MSRPPVALYVHFPFCVSICPYCDFVVQAGHAARGPANRIAALVDTLSAEISLRAPSGRTPLGSVYLGGGTPSLMTPAQVAQLLEAAERVFGLAPGAEVTLEANPGPGERGDLAGFRAAGVNRLSIGAQSFDPVELKRLGRRHSAADVETTVDEARRAGFRNVSLDLLYDVPSQTLESWRETLDTALTLEPDHVSAYGLALDATPDTADHLPPRMGALRWRSRARAAQDADRAADMYELADDVLGAAGLGWYEISNWAVPGRESRHNLAYWGSAAWEAVGPGAHAFDGQRTRRWNAANVERYVAALAAGRLPPGGAEIVDRQIAPIEQAILRLRTREGLPIADASRLGMTHAIEWGMAAGLAHQSGSHHLSLTLRGRLLANELFERMLPEVPAARRYGSLPA